MPGLNYWAVLVAALVAFAVGALWYSAPMFGNKATELRGLDPAAMADQSVPVGKILGELVRSLIVASVLAILVARLGIADWKSAAGFGLLVWIGFPAMILLGSVIWENVPRMLAAIHAGDWLVKLVLMAVILAVWRRS